MPSYDPNQDAYAILGVDPEATPDEIEAAYRRAALLWHPDKSPAPDAADHFHEARLAADILRDPRRRREYDRLRQLQLGSRRTRSRGRSRAARAYAPLAPPPAWMADKVRVQFDAVLFDLKMPIAAGRPGRWADAAGFLALIISITSRDVKFAALALVFLFIARVLAAPPHQGILAWAKIIPGRRIAEYHALDRRADRYDSWVVPFARLSVSVVSDGALWRIQILGFPHAVAPELARVRSLDEARRLARQAGDWLQIPFTTAA